MANLPENTTNPILRPVTQLEITTKVYGGEYIPDDEQQRGISNLQAIELAERDQYIISRVGQAAIPASGDIPAEVGIASLDTGGKVPDSQIPSGITRNTNTQTLTNKTISYADNTLTGVVGETATQTLTNKTISYADNTLTGVVGTSATQTLTNKTIDAKDNVMLCTATSISTQPSEPLVPTSQMMLTVDASGITLPLGSGPYVGYELPMLAQYACNVSYTGSDGAALDELDAGSYITYVWQGSYWIVDAATYDKPTYISSTPADPLEPKKKMIIVIDTSGVVLTLDDGPYDGFELPVLATADCQIVYTGINGSVTKSVQANTYNIFVWDSASSGFWLPRESTAVTGIDDNGQPFAFNIDALTQADGVINLTGTDANGNPFDYGLGRLVTNADEDNLVTGVEVKTSKTFNGKPIYQMVYRDTTVRTGNTGNFTLMQIPNLENIISANGSCTLSNYSFAIIPYSTTATTYISLYTQGTDTIALTYSFTGGLTGITVIVSYTKTTD